MISGLDFVIYVVCVYITKNFKRVISGLDSVIYVVCIYNKKFYACDQWLRFCHTFSVCI